MAFTLVANGLMGKNFNRINRTPLRAWTGPKPKQKARLAVANKGSYNRTGTAENSTVFEPTASERAAAAAAQLEMQAGAKQIQQATDIAHKINVYQCQQKVAGRNVSSAQALRELEQQGLA